MSHRNSDTDNEPNVDDLNTPTALEIKQLIAKLQQSHDLQYKLINLETWALAETMDRFLPGFWSRFLNNRRVALKQFLQRKRQGHLRVQDSELPTHLRQDE